MTPVPSAGATGQAQISADYEREEKNCPRITPVPSAGVTGQALNEEKKENGPQITQITQNEKLYRGRYVEPERIASEEANRSYKVIYCVATLD